MKTNDYFLNQNKLIFVFLCTFLCFSGISVAQDVNSFQTAASLGLDVSKKSTPNSIQNSSINAAEGNTVITHSSSQNLDPFTGVSCRVIGGQTRDNSFFRDFDLPNDFDITNVFNVTAIETGIEAINTPTSYPLVANVYSSDGAFPGGNLTLLGSGTYNAVDADSGTIVSIPVEATVPAGSIMVVEIAFVEDGVTSFFPGANAQPQTGISWIQAPDCGATTPTDYALLGFPNSALVINAVGNSLSFEENFSGVGLALGSIAFGDVDGDSDQDVISTGVVRIGSDGEPEGFNGLAQSLLFTNEGNNLFVADPSAPFNGVSYASSGLGDYNADGDLDFILTGENFRNGINPQTIDQFYLGDGFGNFAQDSRPVNFTNLSRKKIVAGNLDAEASFELLVIGVNSDGMPETKLLDQQLLNQQTILVESSVQSLPSVIEGSIDLGDVDGDGDLDVFISGELVNGTLISNIFLNDGNFQFSLAQNTTFTGVSKGAAKFVDIDSDGDVDLLISGKDSSQNNVFDIHLNDGTGSYTLLDLDGVLDLSSEILVDAIGLADTDGDTDQDLVVTGYNTTTFSTILKFFTNELVPSPDNSSARQLENFIIPEKSVADVKETIKLYPNPTNNGVFSILTPQLKGKATVSINNVMGRALIKKELNIVDASIKVNAQSLRQGVYIVTITQGKQTFNARLMVD